MSCEQTCPFVTEGRAMCREAEEQVVARDELLTRLTEMQQVVTNGLDRTIAMVPQASPTLQQSLIGLAQEFLSARISVADQQAHIRSNLEGGMQNLQETTQIVAHEVDQRIAHCAQGGPRPIKTAGHVVALRCSSTIAPAMEVFRTPPQKRL